MNITSREDKERLTMGSGLFAWNSDIPLDRMVEIVNWYNSLDLKIKDMVDVLRRESANEIRNDWAEDSGW